MSLIDLKMHNSNLMRAGYCRNEVKPGHPSRGATFLPAAPACNPSPVRGYGAAWREENIGGSRVNHSLFRSLSSVQLSQSLANNAIKQKVIHCGGCRQWETLNVTAGEYSIN